MRGCNGGIIVRYHCVVTNHRHWQWRVGEWPRPRPDGRRWTGQERPARASGAVVECARPDPERTVSESEGHSIDSEPVRP